MSVDDAHLSDAPSLRFLAYLSRRLEGLPVLLVAAGRSPDPEGEDVWRQLAEDPVAEVIRPRALSETGAAVMVRERLGARPPTKFCRACHRATGAIRCSCASSWAHSRMPTRTPPTRPPPLSTRWVRPRLAASCFTAWSGSGLRPRTSPERWPSWAVTPTWCWRRGSPACQSRKRARLQTCSSTARSWRLISGSDSYTPWCRQRSTRGCCRVSAPRATWPRPRLLAESKVAPERVATHLLTPRRPRTSAR